MISNNIYMVNPSDIKFDEKIVNFNEIKTDEEYDNMKRDIERRGQIDALPSRNGLVGDGRHRTKICKELKIQVKIYDVEDTMSDRDFVLLCNRSTMKSRNFSKTQLAIAAYKLVKEYELSDKEALEEVGLSRRAKSISYARYIGDSPYGKKNNILKRLLKGESVEINERNTKSVETASRLIKEIEEADMIVDVNKEISTPAIDYNEMIETEIGKELFWTKIYSRHLSVDSNIEIIKLINFTYNLKTKG